MMKVLLLKDILYKKEIYLTVDFGEGKFHDTVWTCDLSHTYIDINATIELRRINEL